MVNFASPVVGNFDFCSARYWCARNAWHCHDFLSVRRAEFVFAHIQWFRAYLSIPIAYACRTSVRNETTQCSHAPHHISVIITAIITINVPTTTSLR